MRRASFPNGVDGNDDHDDAHSRVPLPFGSSFSILRCVVKIEKIKKREKKKKRKEEAE
jgi:hypothetical protein